MEENPKRIYHAAMMDTHTAVEPDLDPGRRAAHCAWLPDWAHLRERKASWGFLPGPRAGPSALGGRSS